MNRDELQDLACKRFGDALGELMLAAYEEDKHDPDCRKSILREFNTLLKEIGCEYAWIPSRLLDEPDALCGYIRGNLDYPAQILANELPNRLTKWLKAMPHPNDPHRLAWAAEGKEFLEDAWGCHPD
jgi:hypothetical protein